MVYVRLKAVQLMKKIVSHYEISGETRDLAIQLLDQFTALATFSSSDHIRIGVVSCLILSSKMIDVCSLRMELFQATFCSDDISRFESEFLVLVHYNIKPTNTPSCIARHLTSIWPNYEKYPALEKSSEMLIGKFWEHDASAHFSPVIVAIVSILLAIGKEIPNSPQSAALHDFLTFVRYYLVDGKSSLNSFYPMFLIDTLTFDDKDLNRCLQAFQSLSSSKESTFTSLRTVSPISVAYDQIHPRKRSMSEHTCCSLVHSETYDGSTYTSRDTTGSKRNLSCDMNQDEKRCKESPL
jgi:hypothetical protein